MNCTNVPELLEKNNQAGDFIHTASKCFCCRFYQNNENNTVLCTTVKISLDHTLKSISKLVCESMPIYVDVPCTNDPFMEEVQVLIQIDQLVTHCFS